MFEVHFRTEVVLDEEHKLLTKAQQRELIRRLADQGTVGAKALRGDLAGCFRLRYDEIRVVFQPQGNLMVVIAIGRRRDDEIYDIANGRR